MASRNIKITVTTLSGERVEVDVAPGHTSQDVVSALVQGGKLPGEDSLGNPIQYQIISDATLSMLAGDRPLLDQGLKDGAELRVKPGARVATARRGAAPW
jgi:hypothetical protein